MLTYERKSTAVLSVNPLGQAPYALYVRKFKCEVDLVEPTWTPLPALVSLPNQADVEILWDEVPSHEAQLMIRIASTVAGQQAQRERAGALRSQLADTIAYGAQPDPGSAAHMSQLDQGTTAEMSEPENRPVVDASALSAIAPEMQKLAADNARRALGFVTDPKMRKMLVDQYRAAGIDIGEDDRIP
jgi:hypothetical protein